MVSGDFCEHDWPGSGCRECFPEEKTVKHDANFSTSTLDIHGNPAPLWAITTLWRHSGNGKTYRVMCVTWLGATDEWGVGMMDVGAPLPTAVLVTRPEHHLHGKRDNGEARYERVG